VNLFLEGNALIGSVPTEICNLSLLSDVRVDCTVDCPCQSCTYIVNGKCQGL
jgi:hypothetical protein